MIHYSTALRLLYMPLLETRSGTQTHSANIARKLSASASRPAPYRVRPRLQAQPVIVEHTHCLSEMNIRLKVVHAARKQYSTDRL